jgi:hypothetical protein
VSEDDASVESRTTDLGLAEAVEEVVTATHALLLLPPAATIAGAAADAATAPMRGPIALASAERPTPLTPDAAILRLTGESKAAQRTQRTQRKAK